MKLNILVDLCMYSDYRLLAGKIHPRKHVFFFFSKIIQSCLAIKYTSQVQILPGHLFNITED